MLKKRVLFAIGSRANYASIKSAMIAVKENPRLQLQAICFASAVLDRFGKVSDLMKVDGLEPNFEIQTLIEGDSLEIMAESTGLALLRLPRLLAELKPDVVITVGDRFETIATAIAATYLNIPLAHTMGGETTGSIDESVRHAITKFAHLHFPATELSMRRIIQMGESPDSIYLTGCPRIDIARKSQELGIQGLEELCINSGVGDQIDFRKPFLLVSQHPVTTEIELAQSQMIETLKAVDDLKIPTVVLWPNADAGAALMSQQIRKWRESRIVTKLHLFKNIPVENYLQIMNLTSCQIGNSSSGLREGAFLGTPVVNIGSRQIGREHGLNVINVNSDAVEIKRAVETQLTHGKYPQSLLYGDGFAGRRIADILASDLTIKIQKSMTLRS